MMDTQIKTIKTIYFGMLFGILLLLAVLYLITSAGPLPLSNTASFVCETLSVLYTLSVIYLTAKLLKFPFVRKYIISGDRRLRFFQIEIMRFAFLESAILLDGALYFLFQMVPNFYLCLISVISFVFLYPDSTQCMEFLNHLDNDEDKQ